MKLNSSYIRALFKEKGWSQNELARQMNISKGTLSDAMSGKKRIGRKFIKALTNVFPDEAMEDLSIRECANTQVQPIEPMPIKAAPYNHQVNAYNFAGEKLGIFKEVVFKYQEQRS